MTISRTKLPSLMKTKKSKAINLSVLSTAFGGGKVGQVRVKASKKYNIRRAKNPYAI